MSTVTQNTVPAGDAAGTGTPPLQLRDIRKQFGGVVAIERFNLELAAGQITALVGDNGAGKSTLVKIISGVYQPTEGELRMHGRPVTFRDASDARRQGVEVVYQDLALADSQPVYMNMFLGRELTRGPLRLLDRRRMARETQELVDALDVRIPSAKATIRDLSGGQRQAVAICRATHWASGLVLMDEPTAALGVAETAKVEQLIMKLRERGAAVLVVSHNLDQVFRIADRVAVLRRGRQVGVRNIEETSRNEIVSMITGASDEVERP
ncbi:ATP-binding cassette domain-containing protein [Micromonospora profundi]|uniref:ATP-binding cassette domain-containing protein n=1 Tax=Micromonospora profundi TaxID=1420889 RepID=UPI003665386D